MVETDPYMTRKASMGRGEKVYHTKENCPAGQQIPDDLRREPHLDREDVKHCMWCSGEKRASGNDVSYAREIRRAHDGHREGTVDEAIAEVTEARKR